MADNYLVRAFKHLKIAIAVDVSGSTQGLVLQMEIETIRSISNLLESSTDDPLTVLPWNSNPHTPIPLPKTDAALEYIQAGNEHDHHVFVPIRNL